MIRLIFRRETLCMYTGMRAVTHETMDIDHPEIEARLVRGGHGESGFDHTELDGVEIIEAGSA